MKELVVISGKGGTGKTSIVASFATLAESKVIVDCDVDAADLHIILDPTVQQTEEFSGGNLAYIRQQDCSLSGKCYELCRYDAIKKIESADTNGSAYIVDEIGCEGCGICAWFCPSKAIDFEPAINGEWFISSTRFGPFVHARLGIAEENSGKLVTVVKNAAKKLARENESSLVLVDGSPGIGCPVISSISGSDYVLIVTEPSLSAMHDMERVIELTAHFNIPTGVCINKSDLNPEVAQDVEKAANMMGVNVIGWIGYDTVFTKAMTERKTVIEYTNEGVSNEIRKLWDNILTALQ